MLYAMFHGDASPRVGVAPSTFPVLLGQGGFWGKVSPRPAFGEMRGGMFPEKGFF